MSLLASLAKSFQSLTQRADHFDASRTKKAIMHYCFNDDRQGEKLAILILHYLGEDLKYALMGAPLQANYRGRNRWDTLKLKPLRIIYIRTEYQNTQLTKTLALWDQMADRELRKLEKLADKRIDGALFDKIALWGNYHILIELTKTSEYASCLKTVVINEQSKIEGVSFSEADSLIPSARHIYCLLSAPWNQIKGQASVKGAGSALIEHAALQSLKQQEIDPPDRLSHSLLKEAMVILTPCGPTRSFYTHLFFVQAESQETRMVLSGENMVKFFNRFGGRATYGPITA